MFRRQRAVLGASCGLSLGLLFVWINQEGYNFALYLVPVMCPPMSPRTSRPTQRYWQPVCVHRLTESDHDYGRAAGSRRPAALNKTVNSDSGIACSPPRGL